MGPHGDGGESGRPLEAGILSGRELRIGTDSAVVTVRGSSRPGRGSGSDRPARTGAVGAVVGEPLVEQEPGGRRITARLALTDAAGPA
ncbi:hypothetical protein ACFY40_29285 [Streptomyces sp. NPDC012950]|uniref:hypothetical protein n=1 Tax=Streptomyces sp. NPDC012950 TaxID=3364858 RepID=UPI0036ABC6B1